MTHTRHAYGPLVRALREARRLTLTELGRATGLTAGYLSRIEREQGKVASWGATIRLAEGLGVIPDHLTGQLPPYRALRQLLGHEDLQMFADSLGLSAAELTDIELGVVEPDPEVLARMAHRLGVAAEALARPVERGRT